MRWLIKHEQREFIYNSDEGVDVRWDRMHNWMAAFGQEGWEPWSISIVHNFSADYKTLWTHASVWLKRPDENLQHR